MFELFVFLWAVAGATGAVIVFFGCYWINDEAESDNDVPVYFIVFLSVLALISGPFWAVYFYYDSENEVFHREN